jgi:hypothetical protein
MRRLRNCELRDAAPRRTTYGASRCVGCVEGVVNGYWELQCVCSAACKEEQCNYCRRCNTNCILLLAPPTGMAAAAAAAACDLRSRPVARQRMLRRDAWPSRTRQQPQQRGAASGGVSRSGSRRLLQGVAASAWRLLVMIAAVMTVEAATGPGHTSSGGQLLIRMRRRMMTLHTTVQRLVRNQLQRTRLACARQVVAAVEVGVDVGVDADVDVDVEVAAGGHSHIDAVAHLSALPDAAVHPSALHAAGTCK